VLDTNVLMHDPTSIFRFEEHDVYIPWRRFEELDNHKKGMSEVSRNARQASRYLDGMITRLDERHHGRHPAPACTETRSATGRALPARPRAIDGELPGAPPSGPKRHTRYSRWSSTCRRSIPRRHVVLVSKDINMRIKAHALGLAAEDYFNDKVLEDTDLL